MRKVFAKDGSLVSEPKRILTEIETFYSELYKAEPLNPPDNLLNSFLNNSNISALSTDDSLICEGMLTNAECLKTLQLFEGNKSPGNDGLTVEFYKAFWHVIGDLMVDSLNYAYECGELSNSQKQAIITLIEKKDKDRRKISNWRPISLINVDVKIGSKAIAKRLEKVLPHIIHHNQNAYVKGRSNFDAVRTIEDILEFTERMQIAGKMIAIDFQKAFDSVDRDFLFNTLIAFNFGPSFLQWIHMFYTNISSCVLNNGFSTRLFEVQRGVRQGDPLSPYFFIMVLEILAIAIRENNNIRGIKAGNEKIKLDIFADDRTAFLMDDRSLINLLEQTGNFGLYAGLNINYDKSEIMLMVI